MEIDYIRTKQGEFFKPQLNGDLLTPFCNIKKLCFGRFQVDYCDPFVKQKSYPSDYYAKPNRRLILYPIGIAEVKYII